MPRYLYQARDVQSQLATGVVAAGSADAASVQLRGEGKFVVRLRAVRESDADPAASTLQDHSRRVRRADVVFFAHQMAVMMETGVPISEALECAAEQAGNPHLREVLRDVAEHVQAGGALSHGLRKHPRAFPPIMTSLIQAGELSGTLGTMLERISRYLDKEERTRRQVKAALTYPCIMVVLALAVTVFVLTFVLPRFAAIYATKQAALPAPTRMLIGLSQSLVHHWPVYLAGAVLLAVAAWLVRQSRPGRKAIDHLKLSLPVLARLYTHLYLSRACRALATMIGAGVPLLDAIGMVRQVTPNFHYQRLWDDVDDALKRGLQLSDPLAECRFLPRSVVQMVRSGEKSGRLPQVLDRLGAFTEDEFDAAVRSTTQFIEPAMVIFMGGMVGFIAISLLLPIFNVSRVVTS